MHFLVSLPLCAVLILCASNAVCQCDCEIRRTLAVGFPLVSFGFLTSALLTSPFSSARLLVSGPA